MEEAARKKLELSKQREQNRKEKMQKKEEKAKSKSSPGKSTTPKKAQPQTMSREIMQQIMSRNKDQVSTVKTINIIMLMGIPMWHSMH